MKKESRGSAHPNKFIVKLSLVVADHRYDAAVLHNYTYTTIFCSYCVPNFDYCFAFGDDSLF